MEGGHSQLEKATSATAPSVVKPAANPAILLFCMVVGIGKFLSGVEAFPLRAAKNHRHGRGSG